MEEIITATRAVREFSDLLNSIKFKGRTVIIERGGSRWPVWPGRSSRKDSPLKRPSELLKELPELALKRRHWKKTFKKLSERKPPLPAASPWE